MIFVSSLKYISGFIFYCLAGSFFFAYMLTSNQDASLASWWLRVADLPLAFVGMVYGGTSLYMSVHPNKGVSTSLALAIAIPLAVLFLVLLICNFWSFEAA